MQGSNQVMVPAWTLMHINKSVNFAVLEFPWAGNKISKDCKEAPSSRLSFGEYFDFPRSQQILVLCNDDLTGEMHYS